MDRTPKPGEFYRHFKNKLYQVITVARHTETGEQLVVYQALYGDFGIYARPLSMFVSQVDREKYPDAGQQFRFERLTFSQEDNHQEDDSNGPEESCDPDIVKVTADRQGDENGGSGVPNPWLVKFLEAEETEEKLECLRQMEGHVKQEELDSLYLVLDMQPEGGTISSQLYGIRRLLETRSRFDGTRLR